MDAGSLERDAVVRKEDAQNAADGEDHAAAVGDMVEAGQRHSEAAPQAAADSPRRPSRTMLHALTERVSPRLESEQSFMQVSEASSHCRVATSRIPQMLCKGGQPCVAAAVPHHVLACSPACHRPDVLAPVQPTGSAPAELASSRSMLRRAQARAEELRVMFHLPPTEVCAMAVHSPRRPAP